MTKQTSWQLPSTGEFSTTAQNSSNYSQQQLSSASSSSLSSSSLTETKPQPSLEQILAQIPMPSGWQQARTARGELYFLNHNTKTTCWEDPRIPVARAYLARLTASNTNDTINSPLKAQQQQQFEAAPIQQIEQIKSTLIESLNRKTELVKSLEALNKQVGLINFSDSILILIIL